MLPVRRCPPRRDSVSGKLLFFALEKGMLKTGDVKLNVSPIRSLHLVVHNKEGPKDQPGPRRHVDNLTGDRRGKPSASHGKIAASDDGLDVDDRRQGRQ